MSFWTRLLMTIARQLISLLFIIALAMLPGCSPEENPWPPGKLKVVVSFPPLDSFVKRVGGDHATVVCLAKESGVHHYEPAAYDATLLRRADFLFANGLGLDDPFLEKVVVNSSNPKLAYVKLGEAIPENQRLKMEDGEIDPHVWLGPTRAVIMVEAIRDQLKEADKGHAKDYDDNAESYTRELKKLLDHGRERFGPLKDKKLLSFHESLNYFAAAFGLDVVGYIEPGPGMEPSTSRYTDIVAMCKNQHIRVIAVEPQYPETAALNVKAELKKRGAGDVRIVEIDPLETATAKDLTNPDWYTKTMTENIDKLADELSK
jgi:ABC-type Zn uptake system ZnuABC Zn-binding protein ZnuA